MSLRSGPVVVSGLMVAALLTASPAQAASFGVSKLSATTGPLVGGERISLHGNGFVHVSKVLFGGATGHSVRVTSAHLLSVVVPKHKAGRVDLRVVTSSGETAAVKTDRFTYVAPPTVTELTTVGTRVTLRGKNFSHVKAVLFGKTKGTTIHVVSTTTLLVTAPAHAPGVVDLHVTTAYGTSRTVKADRLTYAAAPVAGAPTAPVPPGTVTLSPLAIRQLTLAGVEQDVTYAGATQTATGGVPPYTWSAHLLPAGLVLSAGGVLSGSTLAVSGTKPIDVTVTDSTGTTASAVEHLTVTAYPGQLETWGYDKSGALGDGGSSGTSMIQPTPTPVSGLTQVVATCGGFADGFAVKSDGTLWAWGDNDTGDLGVGSLQVHTSPVQVAGLSGVTSVACGSFTTYALTSTGVVFAWGRGAAGELGDGMMQDRSTPVQVPGLSAIVQIAAGSGTGYALRADGTVLAWGINGQGELGDATPLTRSSPVAVGGLTGVTQLAATSQAAYALHSDGTVSGWGWSVTGAPLGDGGTASRFSPVLLPGLTDITQIEGTSQGATGFGVRDDGTLWGWGDNLSGTIGDTTMVSPLQAVRVYGISTAAAVACATYNTYALLADGSVASWGQAADGLLADGTSVGRISAAPATLLTGIVALTASNGVGFAIHTVRKVIVPPVSPPPVKGSIRD